VSIVFYPAHWPGRILTLLLVFSLPACGEGWGGVILPAIVPHSQPFPVRGEGGLLTSTSVALWRLGMQQ